MVNNVLMETMNLTFDDSRKVNSDGEGENKFWEENGDCSPI
jgi:hypothetical protein